MPVKMYRNHQAGPTVLASDPKGTETVEWQGHGDPNGADIQPVSEMMQGLPTFTRCLRRGILSEVDESSLEYLASQDMQQAHWDQRMNASADQAAAVIDQATNNDIVVLPCVGPSTRPDATKCGADVSVKEKAKNDKPPLCNLHADLQSQYVAGEDTIQDGKPVRAWTRVTMGARESYTP